MPALLQEPKSIKNHWAWGRFTAEDQDGTEGEAGNSGVR